MANKVIGDYDATATPVRTDLLLAQPIAGGLYKTYTPADVLGLLEASDVPDLSATKITSDELDTARLPDLSANKITSDELDTARLPAGTLTLGDVALDSTPRNVEDKAGTGSELYLSTTKVVAGDGSLMSSAARSFNILGANAMLRMARRHSLGHSPTIELIHYDASGTGVGHWETFVSGNTWVFADRISGSRVEVLTLGVSSSTPKIGFLGKDPIARPTVSGSRGGNAALESLCTALANLGLITDSTGA